MDYDPIRLEVFKNLLSGIAEEMGVTLCRTAFSPNIKERKDFSCALFDGAGHMIAQAEHIPVHLGAMPMSVLHGPDDRLRLSWVFRIPPSRGRGWPQGELAAEAGQHLGGDQGPAVGGEGQAVDWPGGGGKGQDFAARHAVPEAKGAILAAAGQELAVRAEG